ncbi:MAG: hypothetical protein ABFD52_09280 [Acidobacteriota bacterium]
MIDETSDSEMLEFFNVATVDELHRLLDHLQKSHVVYSWRRWTDGDYLIIFEPFNPRLEPGWQG